MLVPVEAVDFDNANGGKLGLGCNCFTVELVFDADAATAFISAKASANCEPGVLF